MNAIECQIIDSGLSMGVLRAMPLLNQTTEIRTFEWKDSQGLSATKQSSMPTIYGLGKAYCVGPAFYLPIAQFLVYDKL